ncbi:hypothetical protein [Rhizobium sp. RU36D]|uniref:hypothetical protein n=1 Tax=Rhizobium sp. RU36D TaxID=1907415 RepID=UPI0009FD3F3A|nr:hypothetical protein [Rhizobium sp. RU36D]
MAFLSRTSIERMIRILCVIALVCLGLAHKPPAFAANSLSAAEIAALTLPDGTLPELCLPEMHADGKTKPHAMGSDCEACRVTAVVVLPQPSDEVGIRLVASIEASLPKPAEAHYRQLFPPSSAPRAPPATV